MLDFLMNPSFNQNITVTTSGLTPWLIMVMAIVKIALIAIGSLLVSSFIIALGVISYRVFTYCKYKYHCNKKISVRNLKQLFPQTQSSNITNHERLRSMAA